MTKYPWQRYWHKFEDAPNLIDGFLVVWEGLQGNAFQFDKFFNTPCLVLLGEPGIGKSIEIANLYAAQVEDDNNVKHYCNLNSIPNTDYLNKRVFEADKLIAWKNGHSNLYLFLDSLDEALLNINTLSILLGEEISDLPIERLFLRIACRSAEWSSLSKLENMLKTLWKTEEFQILQLAPLQKKDVVQAAETEKLSSDDFLIEIFEKGVSLLAAKPVTLKLLLNLYKDKQTLPSNQSELYEQGCLALLEEDLEEHPSAKDNGLTAHQRLIVAARIAAMMIFANKSSILFGRTIDERTDADILISELAGYSEKGKDGVEFAVSEKNIIETIHKGLFRNDVQPKRIKFSHQTYAEFLAAHYLNYREMPDSTIIELIGDKYLYPQLYETSAWIAGSRISIFRHLMKIAPLVLLRSDVISAEDDLRFKLSERVLEVFDREEAQDNWIHSYYYKLKNSRLAQQLLPFITDKNKGFLVRRVAVDIAEVCNLEELQNALADVALDVTEKHNVRLNAAYAVARIANSDVRARLKPLIFEENDKNHELKGRGLAATWNENLTARELFNVLDIPSFYFHGSYESFFYDFAEKLRPNDLPIALDWLEKHISATGRSISAERVSDRILLKAWEHLDQEDIFSGFVNVAVVILQSFKDVFSNPSAFSEQQYFEKINELRNDDKKRREIWISILSKIDDRHTYMLDRSQYVGIKINDIEWLIERWKVEQNVELKKRLLEKLYDFLSYWGAYPEALSKFYQEYEKDEVLQSVFQKHFAAIEIGSDEAQELKQRHEKQFEWQKEHERELEERNTPVKPSPMERTLEFLDKFEAGNIDSWWQINWFMMFLPNGMSDTSELEADLTKFPVWKESDKRTKSRIIEASKEYLLKGHPQTEEWIGTNTIHRPAYAGYRAIKLLQEHEPEFLETLDMEVWDKWASIIYSFPIFNGSGQEDYDAYQQLIARVYLIVPEAIITFFRREIANKDEDPYWAFDKLDYCWDERLVGVLRAQLEIAKSDVSLFRKILGQLFKLNDPEIESYTCDLIPIPIPEDDNSRQLIINSIELLIKYGKIGCWNKIWSILNDEVEFGKKIIEFGVFRFGNVNIQQLPEKELADLYIWLSTYYPHKQDPVHRGSYSPGARDEIVRWRDSILRILSQKGTPQAVEEVARIKNELYHLEWLKFVLLETQEKMHETAWAPLTTRGLTELFFKETVSSKQVDSIILHSGKILLWNQSVDRIPHLSELLEEYHANSDEIVFFVGSGLSTPLFPDWSTLLKQMIGECFSNESIGNKDSEELMELVARDGNLLEVAEFCRSRLGDSYYPFLESVFNLEFSIDKVSRTYRQLFKLQPKLIITTNFDLIPERLASSVSLKMNSQSEESYVYRILDNTKIAEANKSWKREPLVFKMHGSINNPESIVFTANDFAQMIQNNPQMKQFVTTVLGAKRVVFLGFSFSDPHIKSLLEYIYAIYGGQVDSHYGLMSDLSSFRKETLSNLGLKIIEYKSSGGHPEVFEFLQVLEKVKNKNLMT
jgi:hypothetical protein